MPFKCDLRRYSEVCNDVGFNSEKMGLDGNNCRVLVELHDQSPEIGAGGGCTQLLHSVL
jgi:S-adenosylmethionine synthetase